MEPLQSGPPSVLNFLNVKPNNSNNSNICIKLENISNYRSLGGMPIGTDGRYFVRPGCISRSATPTNASFSDEFWLLEILSIKTLIDLRTSWENKTISPVRKFEDNFIQYSIKERSLDKSSERSGSLSRSTENPTIVINNGQRAANQEKDMEEQKNGILWRIYNSNLTGENLLKMRQHSTGALRKRYSIPLINNKFFLDGVYATAPNDTRLKCNVSRYILFNDSVGAFMLMNHLNDLGIIEMYKLTLVYTQEEILTIMRILKNKDNYPIMYYCSLGKDRTGMTTALLLSCLGVERELIIEDYSKSEENLKASLDQIKRYFTRVGLAKDEFIRSHKSTMAGLLNWVDQTYGSVNEYLNTIGFTYEEQEELRRNLIVSKDEYEQLASEAINIPDLQQRKDEYIANAKQLKKSPKLSPRVLWRRFSNTNNNNNNHNNNNTTTTSTTSNH